MTKTKLLANLLAYSPKPNDPLGTEQLVKLLTLYFTNSAIPEYGRGKASITAHLPKHLARAIELLCESDDPRIIAVWHEFCQAAGYTEEDLPSVTELQFGGAKRHDFCLFLSHWLTKIMAGHDNGWLEAHVLRYAMAQETVVQQQVDQFELLVFQNGLAGLIDKFLQDTASGQFGFTSLHSTRNANDLVISLRRKQNDMYVAFDGRRCGAETSFGNITTNAKLAMILEMFEDIFENWPSECVRQREMFKADKIADKL